MQNVDPIGSLFRESSGFFVPLYDKYAQLLTELVEIWYHVQKIEPIGSLLRESLGVFGYPRDFV